MNLISRNLYTRGHSQWLQLIFFAAILAITSPSFANPKPNVVVQWNQAALRAVRDGTIGPPMVARALMIVHECMYDAWAAYDAKAVGTQLGGTLRQPKSERSLANKKKALSFAAYRAVVDVLGWDTDTVFIPLMTSLGYDPNDMSTDTTTPSGVGNVACAAVLNSRHNDGSNQLGNLTPSGVPYADYTGYTPVNEPASVPLGGSQLLPTDMGLAGIVDPNHWQPLTYFNGTKIVTPSCMAAQWYMVTPFALASADEFVAFAGAFGPALYGSFSYVQQARNLISTSANLNDRQKMIAEYWANGPHSETPPGHWNLFAQYVSARDKHAVGADAKMFFILNSALHDAAVATWTIKRHFDSIRPVSAIPFLFQGHQIQSWGGPGMGTITMDGSMWTPYQPSTFPTPPFQEYVSGHSTFSAAGATALALFTGSETFGDFVILAAGSSEIEPGITPAAPVTLSWKHFHDAANQAGISRRYGGIHFKTADVVGRAVGNLVGLQAYGKALLYIYGTANH
jgi:membrane-associated phospholipid phosphatase